MLFAEKRLQLQFKAQTIQHTTHTIHTYIGGRSFHTQHHIWLNSISAERNLWSLFVLIHVYLFAIDAWHSNQNKQNWMLPLLVLKLYQQWMATLCIYFIETDSTDNKHDNNNIFVNLFHSTFPIYVISITLGECWKKCVLPIARHTIHINTISHKRKHKTTKLYTTYCMEILSFFYVR